MKVARHGANCEKYLARVQGQAGRKVRKDDSERMGPLKRLLGFRAPASVKPAERIRESVLIEYRVKLEAGHKHQADRQEQK